MRFNGTTDFRYRNRDLTDLLKVIRVYAEDDKISMMSRFLVDHFMSSEQFLISEK